MSYVKRSQTSCSQNRNHWRRLGWSVAWSAVLLHGQTQVDLATQSKRVDFTQAPSTAPVKAGTTLPASCTVGELFYDTDAPAGQNLYGCVATNTWSLQAGGGVGGGGAVNSVSGTTNEISVNSTTGAVTISLPSTVDLGGKSALKVPTSTVPITNSVGMVAADSNAWGGRGSIQFFDGTSNTYLIGVQGSDTPLQGQIPVWNTGGTITWENPATVGTTALSQLTDLKVSLAGSTYTIGGGAVAFGDATTVFPSATLAESDGDDSGTIYFCADLNNGSPRLVAVIPPAFTEANYTGTGLVVVDGAGCPEDAQTLATSIMISGTPSNPVDFRPAVQVSAAVLAGAGLVKSVGSSGRSRTLSIDKTSIVQKFTGSGAPTGTISGSTLGDFYVDTAAQKAYTCMSAGGNCSGVAAGQWVLLN